VEVPEEVSAQSMLEALRKAAPRIVTEIGLFDVYRGKGIDSDKKSVAFRILLQDTLETLTDAEIENAKEQLIKVLQKDFKATLRNEGRT
jgi:phenylalanyl-tRNA synthetase beta chain